MEMNWKGCNIDADPFASLIILMTPTPSDGFFDQPLAVSSGLLLFSRKVHLLLYATRVLAVALSYFQVGGSAPTVL